MTRQPTSNVNIAIRLKGTDFTGTGGTIAITNVDYDDDGGESDGDSGNLAQTGMEIAYPGSLYATLTSGSPTLDVWFWLNVPGGQAAGTYASTFSFQGI